MIRRKNGKREYSCLRTAILVLMVWGLLVCVALYTGQGTFWLAVSMVALVAVLDLAYVLIGAHGLAFHSHLQQEIITAGDSGRLEMVWHSPAHLQFFARWSLRITDPAGEEKGLSGRCLCGATRQSSAEIVTRWKGIYQVQVESIWVYSPCGLFCLHRRVHLSPEK